jgi:hypothetical protein
MGIEIDGRGNSGKRQEGYLTLRNFKVVIRKLKKNASAECRGYSSGFVVATSLC